MKYTVVIRQPVPDEVRPNLEKELVERFGLNEQQAERLAGRRAGRLLKPTTQARADLLLRVYQSVGAQVLMEEIPEDGDTPSQAFRAAPAQVDDAVLAPPMQNNVSMAEFSTPVGGDAFSPADGTFTPSDDPFAATFAPITDPSPTLPLDEQPLPDWAVKDRNVPPDNNPEVNLLGGLPTPSGPILSSKATPSEAAIAQELQSATATATKPAVADDWADFAGGLNLPETTAPVTTAPRATTEFLTAVTEEAPSKNLPRTSLASRIRWGTLLPVALSSLLTLGLLALSLPGQQNRVTQSTARNLAAMIGGNMDSSIQSVNDFQLKALMDNPEVGFVRVEQRNNKSYVRSRDAAQNTALDTQLAAWTKTNPDTGRLKVGNETYMVSRVALVNTPDGTVMPAMSAAQPDGTVERYVTVGMSTHNTAEALRNLLLLTLLSSLIGLLIASFLANQSARRIMQPISDLVKAADSISLGDLTRPVKTNSNDELGDLAQALERMRLSLEAAMDRLRRRKRG